MSKRVAVVGGGAAGFAAAITAARNGCDVTILESQDRVGNSIKVTGDGRCNIANAQTSANDYFNDSFVASAFEEESPEDALRFLESCGLVLREEAQGRLYPQANKSTSVIDALRLAAARFGARVSCGRSVRGVVREKGCWAVTLEDGSKCRFDSVILACGGRLSPSILPKEVKLNAMQPLLGPMATSTQALRGLDKVRAKCSLSVAGHCEDGEATFRSYGISGIAAFNLTRFAKPGDVIVVDFLPQFAREDSLALLQDRLSSLQPETWLDLSCGMLLPLVARAILRQAGLDPEGKPRRELLARFDNSLRGFELEYRGIGDAKLCQVNRGGVRASQVDPATMQIKGQAGLHVAGEMIDVDGPCGGYNLHWAWVSGMIAGKAVSND